ncbi:hypothetical protein L6452_02884 [Arctium lappa]|uniref:Uncharacterized protein n=1 Tax=Arctium lappa TaxID=4217 RepID=A0ACB9FMB3_ARCLA|nr:hypothetical protein L6452_02884 [Arctium lappa]
MLRGSLRASRDRGCSLLVHNPKEAPYSGVFKLTEASIKSTSRRGCLFSAKLGVSCLWKLINIPFHLLRSNILLKIDYCFMLSLIYN